MKNWSTATVIGVEPLARSAAGCGARDVQSVTEPGAARPAPVPITVGPAGRRRGRALVWARTRRVAHKGTSVARWPTASRLRGCEQVFSASSWRPTPSGQRYRGLWHGTFACVAGACRVAARQKSLLQVVPG